MHYVTIVLDSCRYDLFKQLYDGGETRFFNALGPPHKAYSHSNVTTASFVLMFGHGYFPKPTPPGFPFKRAINFIAKFPGYHKTLVTGMPWLWPGHLSVKSLLGKFDDVDFLGSMRVCEHGVKRYNQIRDRFENLFFLLWTGETHNPYGVGGNRTKWLTGKISAYNKGVGDLPKSYLQYLRGRQKEMIKYCDRQLSKLAIRTPAHVVVVADHGESIGENHKVGHGHDIHPVQFTVPLQHQFRGG